ncbi:MAG TPA: ribosome small subunit-dependent GTPase A [Polyangiales bacterium]|nr:ribosome small subunit-dependent GTPase A [Polyangiales bacterium]
MKLEDIGYGEPYASAFALGNDQLEVPARVVSAQREQYLLWCEAGVVPASISGRMRHEAAVGELPGVGDWVAAKVESGRASVQRLLPRKSMLARKRPGPSSEPQLMAANLDYVFVVSALNQDFSPRRLERALALIWDGGAQPVVVLTKLDQCPEPASFLDEAQAVALGVPVHAVSVHAGIGLEALASYLRPARTIALIGSSGVGKSTLVNHCLGEERAAISEARAEDDKGRHTTTARELFLLPTGALLIDTPGMRELGMVDADLDTTFADLDALAAHCRFGDCEHAAEPGCAVRAALQRNELDAERFAAYGKLQRELAYERSRSDDRARHQHDRERRRIHTQHVRAHRAHPKR